MKILYVGSLDPFGTSLSRLESLRKIEAGVQTFDVDPALDFSTKSALQRYVERQLGWGPRVRAANRALVATCRELRPDLVWIDKGLWLRPRTLRRLRVLLPRARFVGYSPDDMGNPSNQSRRYLDSLPLYDLHVTTKSYNVEELSALGAREREPRACIRPRAHQHPADRRHKRV